MQKYNFFVKEQASAPHPMPVHSFRAISKAKSDTLTLKKLLRLAVTIPAQ